MEEKQKKNSYGIEFYRSVTKTADERGLLKKAVITSGEILTIIAELAGESYKPTSGGYLLKKWEESVKDLLTSEKRTVYSEEKGRKVHTIVFVPKSHTTVESLTTEDDKLRLINNLLVFLDRQEAARNNSIYMTNLREMWVGDTELKGVAILCKAAKTLRSTFDFGFTYEYDKVHRLVRIKNIGELRNKLTALLPKEKPEEVKLNQFVRLTEVAEDTMYLMAAIINKSHRGIELYSLAKFVSEAPSLIKKNLSTADLGVLIKTVGKEYFTLGNGSNIVSLTVGAWDKIRDKYDPKDRFIEVPVLLQKGASMENVTMINEEIGLGNLITDCSWEEFKKLGRQVFAGKVTLPMNPDLEKKLRDDVENDLLKVQEMENPLA